MIQESHTDRRLEVEYYLVDGDHVGRVRFDRKAEDYIDGEMIDEDGEWYECSVTEILADGDEITEREARERVRELGGTMDEED